MTNKSEQELKGLVTELNTINEKYTSHKELASNLLTSMENNIRLASRYQC